MIHDTEKMIVIPAVDIKDGRCVRLIQGRKGSETVYSDDPAAMATKWVTAGAECLHVIDLDGAFEKGLRNASAIEKIVSHVSIPVQVGGGIRNLETVQHLLGIGVSRVIIGTEAIRNPTFVENCCRRYPGKIVVGIDARNGQVLIEGWTETTGVSATDLAKRFEDCGAAAINFTDIKRDGMLTGPNIAATAQLAKAVSVPVVASGGVSGIEDIKRLMSISKLGIVGVIVGKALYSGNLDLAEAISLTKTARHDD